MFTTPGHHQATVETVTHPFDGTHHSVYGADSYSMGAESQDLFL
jgi:hypothetical protein